MLGRLRGNPEANEVRDHRGLDQRSAIQRGEVGVGALQERRRAQYVVGREQRSAVASVT